MYLCALTVTSAATALLERPPPLPPALPESATSRTAMETPVAQQAAVPSSARVTDAAQQPGFSWESALAAYLRAHPAADAATETSRAQLVEAVLRQPETPGAWLAFLEAEVRGRLCNASPQYTAWRRHSPSATVLLWSCVVLPAGG